MAGYAKIWTDIFDDEWFVALSGLQRGFWLQLIVLAKRSGDTGVICVRSYSHLALVCGMDDSSTAKNGRFFASQERLRIKEEKHCISIEICNYHKWQQLDAKEHLKNKHKFGEKRYENRPLPEKKRKEKTNNIKLAAPVNNDLRIITDHWVEKYQEKMNSKYVFLGKDGVILNRLLKLLGKEKLTQSIDSFFYSSDPFIQKAGYTTGVFSSIINKLQIREELPDVPVARIIS
ncbi:MAG: hypothetical protein WC365_08255 [Candidatus Babeliales bacterium]|jgi:hypothetical protein